MLTDYDVLKTILITEKGTALGPQNKYAFKVNMRANKIQIKKAVELIYKVKVQAVNTLIMFPKFKRLRHKGGFTSKWKKAIVTLQKGHKIEIAH